MKIAIRHVLNCLLLSSIGTFGNVQNVTPDANANQVSSTPVHISREACKEYMAATSYANKDIACKNREMRDMLLVRHGALWPRDPSGIRDLSSTDDLTDVQQALLLRDLNGLMEIIKTIDRTIIPQIYGTPVHTSPSTSLQIALTSGANFYVAACTRRGIIVISPLLVERLWLTSIAAHTPWEKDLDSPERLLAAVALSKPPDVPYIEAAKDPAALDNLNRYGDLNQGAFLDLKLANIEYIKGLLFVLSHEAAHFWIDGCPARPPSTLDEVRADDYALLVSTTWLGEQFSSVSSEVNSRNFRNVQIEMAKKERDEARRRITANQYSQDFDSQYDKLSDPALANQTDAEIVREVDRALKRDSGGSSDDSPFGKLGYETMADVYEKAGLTERYGSHPSLATRVQRLERGFKSENLKGRDILLERVGSEQRLLVMAQKANQQNTATAIKPLLKAFNDASSATFSECENLP